MRKTITLLFIALACIQVSFANGEGRQAIVAQKNFALCSRMGRDAKVSAVLAADPVLSEITRTGRDAFRKAETEQDALQEALFSEEEIARIGDRLSSIASNPILSTFCQDLKKEGKYCVYNDLPDRDFLKAAWKQDAGGINLIIRVYGMGNKSRYKIDAPDPTLETVPFYQDAVPRLVRPAIRENALEILRNGLFFSLPLEVAIEYLDINDRYEAADFEPMGQGINALSYAAVRKTKWKKYPYSAILILGSGPQADGEAISPKTRVRCVYAAELYRQGKAPFIMLSGGRAYPAMTKFSEAQEMKRYLMENCGIPEKALIAEPHARHTTTNLRNAARIMIENGCPMDKPALITSTGDQLDDVQSEKFARRCQRDILMVPYRLGERTGNRTLEFWPLPCATHLNPLDPLDP